MKNNVRNSTLGVLVDTSFFDKDDILSVFNKASLIQEFELYLQSYMKEHNLGIPIYLSLGQEFVPASVSTVFRDCSIFAQHRCHGWYIAYGGNIQNLIDELLGRESGCCRGMSGSASISDSSIKMFGHSGLLGDQVPIAVGAAIGGIGRVLSVSGDAAVEEDYVLASLGFAASRSAPILFICEDNDLSILTRTTVRRKWNICDVAKSFGIESVDIADDPWTIMYHIKHALEHLPFFINVRVCRKLWHAGAGCDGEPEWDRYAITRRQMVSMGLESQVEKIETDNKKLVHKLWQEQLRNLQEISNTT